MDIKELKKDIPKNIFYHLRVLLKETELPQTDESLKTIADAWLTKKALFQKMTEYENFRPSDKMQKDDKSGCIAITYSGSIIAVGPLANDKREVQYTSIAMRTDVPESVISKDSVLGGDISCGSNIVFARGEIKKTSPIMDLAI